MSSIIFTPVRNTFRFQTLRGRLLLLNRHRVDWLSRLQPSHLGLEPEIRVKDESDKISL